MTLTESLGDLGEEPEPVGVTICTTTGSREPLRLQQRSQLTARGKAGEGKQRIVSGLRLVASDGGTHTPASRGMHLPSAWACRRAP